MNCKKKNAKLKKLFIRSVEKTVSMQESYNKQNIILIRDVKEETA